MRDIGHDEFMRLFKEQRIISFLSVYTRRDGTIYEESQSVTDLKVEKKRKTEFIHSFIENDLNLKKSFDGAVSSINNFFQKSIGTRIFNALDSLAAKHMPVEIYAYMTFSSDEKNITRRVLIQTDDDDTEEVIITHEPEKIKHAKKEAYEKARSEFFIKFVEPSSKLN